MEHDRVPLRIVSHNLLAEVSRTREKERYTDDFGHEALPPVSTVTVAAPMNRRLKASASQSAPTVMAVTSRAQMKRGRQPATGGIREGRDDDEKWVKSALDACVHSLLVFFLPCRVPSHRAFPLA